MTARIRGPWLGPLGGWEEAAQSHPLIPTGHGGRRPPVTRTAIQREDFKSLYINKIHDIPQQSTTEFNTKITMSAAP